MNFYNLARTKKQDLYGNDNFGYHPRKIKETATMTANRLNYFEADFLDVVIPFFWRFMVWDSPYVHPLIIVVNIRNSNDKQL